MRPLLDKEDPILRQHAMQVPHNQFGNKWLVDLANELLEIMQAKGAVGVAAPQIGESWQVVVFGTNYTQTRTPEQSIDDTVLVNPSYKPIGDKQEQGQEGCLNCGDLRGMVPRYQEVEYSGYDAYGNWQHKRASGLEARIVQHEIDHLNGFLFIDRIDEENESYSNNKITNKLQP